MSDPYSILGISRNASDDEVKKAYRIMCRKYHPDKNPGNAAAEDMFKVVQEAYEQIMNERKNGGTGYAGADQGGFGGFGQGASASTDADMHKQAAANYINSRHYNEALNVLAGISDRDAQWYYLSALAQQGLGNTYAALELARTASSMEPSNMYYRSFVSSLESGGYNYGNMQNPYGGFGRYNNNNDDFCMKMCVANLCLNAFCDGDMCCCC